MTDPTVAAGAFTCRLLEDGDSASVSRLWQSETPWGEPPRETVEWFNRNPTPGSFVVVAVDDRGEVVGQMVAMATRVCVDGREVSAIHLFAPIVARAARERATSILEHPVLKLIWFAFTEAKRRGFAIGYSLPDPKWAGLFRRTPFVRVGKFPLWSLPLPLDDFAPLGDEYRIVRLETLDHRVDRLWHAAAQRSGCQSVRDASALRWKLETAPFETIGVERGGELVGVVASRQKETQWTICDLVSMDDDLRGVTLAAACSRGHSHALLPHQKAAPRKVALLVTPGLETHATRLGFKPDAYDYLLMATSLDPSIDSELLAPERWYISDNE